MESQFIEIADGNLVAMAALSKMLVEYGEDTMLMTLLPAMRKNNITGAALAGVFQQECKANAVICAVKICPLLCVRKHANRPTPVCPPALA